MKKWYSTAHESLRPSCTYWRLAEPYILTQRSKCQDHDYQALP